MLLWSTCLFASAEEKTQPPVTMENSIGMQMVLIPAGEFWMGTEESLAALKQAYPDLRSGGCAISTMNGRGTRC